MMRVVQTDGGDGVGLNLRAVSLPLLLSHVLASWCGFQGKFFPLENTRVFFASKDSKKSHRFLDELNNIFERHTL